jgi:hypothetical protein
LNKFGISNDTINLVVAAIDDNDDGDGERAIERIRQLMGEEAKCELEDVELALAGAPMPEARLKRLKKVYKIQNAELESASLEDAVICRMSTKDCL